MNSHSPPTPTGTGDSGEFPVLLEAVLAPALKTAMFLTRSAEDAEDLTQEAAIQAFRAFEQFEQNTNFKAWFLKIQHNCFLNRLRHDARRPQTVQVEDDEAIDSLYLWEQTRGIGMHKGGGDPAGALLDRLDAEQIASAIRALPDEFRGVATLYFVSELDYKQIAQVMDCPLNTVRSRLHRGRKLLQKELWDLASERGIVSGSGS